VGKQNTIMAHSDNESGQTMAHRTQ